MINPVGARFIAPAITGTTGNNENPGAMSHEMPGVMNHEMPGVMNHEIPGVMNHAPTTGDRPQRKSMRLRDYDYSWPGLYFVTICAHQRQALFGAVINGEMIGNAMATVVNTLWQQIPQHHAGIECAEHIVMPNHFHAIIKIIAPPTTETCGTNKTTVGARFIAPATTGATNNAGKNPGAMNCGNPGAMNCAPTVGDVVRGFKARCTSAINALRQLRGAPVWQRNYYEHIIRDEKSYLNIAHYIQTNPQRWLDDIYHV